MRTALPRTKEIVGYIFTKHTLLSQVFEFVEHFALGGIAGIVTNAFQNFEIQNLGLQSELVTLHNCMKNQNFLGGIGAMAVYPIDLVKTRIQNQGSGPPFRLPL